MGRTLSGEGRPEQRLRGWVSSARQRSIRAEPGECRGRAGTQVTAALKPEADVRFRLQGPEQGGGVAARRGARTQAEAPAVAWGAVLLVLRRERPGWTERGAMGRETPVAVLALSERR